MSKRRNVWSKEPPRPTKPPMPMKPKKKETLVVATTYQENTTIVQVDLHGDPLDMPDEQAISKAKNAALKAGLPAVLVDKLKFRTFTADRTPRKGWRVKVLKLGNPKWYDYDEHEGQKSLEDGKNEKDI